MQNSMATQEVAHETSKSNVLLTELVIVILFFALTAATVMQIFVGAHQKSQLNARITEASIIAQDTAELLAQETNPEQVLLENGYTKSAENEYTYKTGENRAVVRISSETKAGGNLIFSTITLYNDAADRAKLALMQSKGIKEAQKPTEGLVSITAATYVPDLTLGNAPSTELEQVQAEEAPVEEAQEGVSE